MSVYIKFILSCAVLLSFTIAPIYGQEAGSEGDFSDSFDTDINTPEIKLDLSDVPKDNKKSDDSWNFNGFVKTEFHVGTEKVKKGSATIPNWQDEPYYSKSKLTFNFNLEAKLPDGWKARANFNVFRDFAYETRGYESYTEEVIESMESEAEIRDFYFEGNMTDGLTLKAGRQIVVWGQSQTSQLNDLVNPRDNRELGLIDVEDARLPVVGLNFGFELLGANVNIIRVLEQRGDKTAARGSEYDAYASLESNPLLPVFIEEPSKVNFKPEMFARMQWQLNGADISLFMADTIEDQAFFSYAMFTGIHYSLYREYNRIHSVGFSANKTVGSWMLRGEYAAKKGVMFARSDMATQIPAGGPLSMEKDLEQTAVSVEYTGFSDTTISLEVTNDHIVYHESVIAQEENTGSTTFMASHNSFRETWKNRIFIFGFGEATVVRVDSSYDSSVPGLTPSIGFILYMASDPESPVHFLEGQNRAYFSLKYSI